MKCIFIDPPYNTRSAFEHYDDNLEHSQWLTMMLPRLQLLRELLAEDGSIWVTIDDNEGHYLKVLMDEVFGRRNFITSFAWQKTLTRRNDAKVVPAAHDHVLSYGLKGSETKLRRLEADARVRATYTNRDSDPRGDWLTIPFHAPNVRPNLTYPITTPGGRILMPPAGRCWSTTREAKELVEGTQAEPFSTPKPERLLKRILALATSEDDLVLDSFFGSATTAAVAHKMGRRWIGIEMGEHALTHCLPRLQKVVAGEQGGISEAVGWQGGGGFRFLELGAPLFDAAGEIHAEVRVADLAAFVWLRETGTALAATDAATPALGVHDRTAYHLLFNGILGDRRPAGGNVLTSAVLATLKSNARWHDGPKVIYGEACRLGAARLDAERIVFRQLPHAVPR